jgi:hypothetical protein
MMLDNTNGQKGTRIKREDLLKELKKNRDEHRATFEKAVVGYRKVAIEELDRMLTEAKEGKRIRRGLELVEPMDQTKDYDRVIKMLEMSVDDVVILDSAEFAQYVMDDWHWKDAFTSSNAIYTR